MKVCICGAGAIGGLIGARMAAAGDEVSVLARPATAAAIAEHGLRLEMDGAQQVARVDVRTDARALGPQDLVVLAVKAPALADAADGLRPLLAAQTRVLVAMNGVPWWYFARFGGALTGTRLEAVDPGGRAAAAVPIAHVIGCVVHLSAAAPQPGRIRHVAGRRLIIGEPGGALAADVDAVGERLRAAGFEVEVSAAIEREIWYKLWGNMTINPVSALTGATADRVLDDPLVAGLCLAVMAEAARIGARIGCPITQSGEDRNAVTRKLGAFKTSMLQDVEAGRPPEIGALLGAVREIGGRVGEPTPFLDALLGLVRLQARVRGLLPDAGPGEAH